MATRRRATRRQPARKRAAGKARGGPQGPATKAALARTIRTLERRLAQATTALRELRAAQLKKIAAVRRGADRRLAAMVRELAALRHHEARAVALERLLQQRAAVGAGERGDDGEAASTPG